MATIRLNDELPSDWQQKSVNIVGAFVHEVRDFLCAIESGTPASPSFADGLAVQRVLTAIELSAAAGGSGTQV